MSDADNIPEVTGQPCCRCENRGKCCSCECKKQRGKCTIYCRNPMCKFKVVTGQPNTSVRPATQTDQQPSTSSASSSSAVPQPTRRYHPYANNSARNLAAGAQPSRNSTLEDGVQAGRGEEERIARSNRARILQMSDGQRLEALLCASDADPRLLQPLVQEERRPYVRVMEGPVPAFCSCGQCIAMADQRMNICCRHPHCITSQHTFHNICMRPDNIEVMNILNWSVRINDDPNLGASKFRNQAYRNFILWQFGKLGRGNRRVPPSCVVARIRWQFPDADNTYTGYQSFSDLDE